MPPYQIWRPSPHYLEQIKLSEISDKQEKQMKKSDLRTGMIVTLDCGRKGRVMIGVRNCGITRDFVCYEVGGWDSLDNWNHDLTSDIKYCNNIVKVEMCDCMGDLLEFDARNKKTLWEMVTETPAEKEKREIVEQMEELTERLNKLEVK